MARSRSSPPSSSWATTCCSSRYAASKLRGSAALSGFGLNGINRTVQSTTVQLNAQALTRLDAGSIVQDVAVGGGNDGVATAQRRVRAECAQTRRLPSQLFARLPKPQDG